MSNNFSRAMALLVILFLFFLIFLLPNAAYPKPFNPNRSYCNVDGQVGPLNKVCYSHDVCYANPKGQSRLDCDNTFLSSCKKTASSARCSTMYGFIRTFGWSSWNRSRAKDQK